MASSDASGAKTLVALTKGDCLYVGVVNKDEDRREGVAGTGLFTEKGNVNIINEHPSNEFSTVGTSSY